MNSISDRLSAANINLSKPLAPAARYVAAMREGSYIYISGQVSMDENGGITGRVGRDIDLQGGIAAARLCGINVLSRLSAELMGNLECVRKVVRLNGYVQVSEGFSDIARVMDGCSGLFLDIFGEKGIHTRTSIGVYMLPRNCAVEVDAIVAVD